MSEEAQAAAEEAVADALFGPAEPPKEDPKEDEYQPDPKPVTEGDESENDSEEVEKVEASEETDEPELVEFEWDGQLLEAPPAIKEALMRQQDYTQKTQEVSAQRKSIEVTLGEVEQRKQQFEFAQSVQPDLLKAQQLEATANEAREYLKNNLDDLPQSGVMKWQMAIEDARRERDELVQSVTNKQVEFQQAQKQAHEELLKKGTEVLRGRIPGWNEEGQKAVRDYALTAGFTEAELNGVVDPRQVETLWKAAQFDSLQAGKTAAVKQVQTAPTIKSKSRNPMPKDTQNKLNLRKKLKSDKVSNADKASLIGESIADKFFT